MKIRNINAAVLQVVQAKIARYAPDAHRAFVRMEDFAC
jgi:hypothetical protein